MPENLIEAIIKSNQTRKEHIVNMIMNKKPKTVGIYRLTMKTNSDNFRASAIQDIILYLKENNVKVVIYEPTLNSEVFADCEVVKDFDEFKKISDVILANRQEKILDEVKDKVYTRDIYNRD